MIDDINMLFVHMYKARLYVAAVIAIILGLCAETSYAQGTATVPSKVLVPVMMYDTEGSTTPGTAEIHVGSGQVKTGDNIVIPVDIMFPEGIGAAAVTISIAYDSAALTVAECTVDPDAVFHLALCNTPQAGIIKFSAVRVDNTSQESIGLARISFQAVGQPNQTTPLDVQVTTFVDEVGGAFQVVDADGSVQIIP